MQSAGGRATVAIPRPARDESDQRGDPEQGEISRSLEKVSDILFSIRSMADTRRDTLTETRHSGFHHDIDRFYGRSDFGFCHREK